MNSDLGFTLLVLIGLAFIGGSFLLRAGRVRRRGLIGYRAPAALRSDRAWYAGQRAAWIPSLLTGVSLVGGGIGALIAPGMAAEHPWIFSTAAGFVVFTILGMVTAERGARREGVRPSHEGDGSPSVV